MKIADFSLSRLLSNNNEQCSEDQCYTGQVATRRYRAPELLFGSVRYDQSIDMWSVGCILAEMQMKTPLFAVGQLFHLLKLDIIYNILLYLLFKFLGGF